jgi:Rrf2 family protein
MMELALREGSGRVQAHEIASAQDISPGYLEHLLAALRKASLLRSVRGQHGGYELARPADKINLREVVEALEGPIAPVECVFDAATCDDAERCATRDVWCEVANAVSGTLEQVTLSGLCRRQRGLWEDSPLMFQI